MDALSNKKLRHELGQSDRETVQTNGSDKLASTSVKELNEEYELIKDKLKEEGYNQDIFDVNIPQAYKAQRKDTEEQQVEELVKKGATFSASGIFMNTGSMLITSDALLSASKQVLDNRNKAKQDKVDKESDKAESIKLKAIEAYDVFKASTSKGDKTSVATYTKMLKYLLVATESSDKISSFKTKTQIMARIMDIDKWEDVFLKLKGEREVTTNEVETATDTAQGENELISTEVEKEVTRNEVETATETTQGENELISTEVVTATETTEGENEGTRTELERATEV